MRARERPDRTTPRKRTRQESRARVATALQALGIVVVYFGVVVALTYPVGGAAGYLR